MGNIVFVRFPNSTDPEELLEAIYNDTSEIIFLYLSSILMILIIGLNVLVGISVSIMRRRKDVQNMCFAFTQNLCLADIFVGFTIMTIAFRLLSPPVVADPSNAGVQQLRCSIRVFLVGTSCQVSICALGTIAADRYSTIRRPFDRGQFLLSSKGAWMLNGVIWVIAIMTNLLPIAGWRLNPDIDTLCQRSVCRVSCLNFIPRGFVIILCAGIFLPMLCLIVILYSKILVISVSLVSFYAHPDHFQRTHLNSITEFDPKSSVMTRAPTPSAINQSLSQSTASLSGRRYSLSGYFSQSSRSGRNQSIIARLRRKASKKALRTLGLLLGCFLITWCPFVGLFLFESCYHNHIRTHFYSKRNLILDWLLLLGMSNSLMNPIVYGRTNKEFKRFLAGLYRQTRRTETNEITRSRASSISLVCGQHRELVIQNYEERCLCQNCLTEANRSSFLHPYSDFHDKDSTVSCSALEPRSNGQRRSSTISLNIVRRFAWYSRAGPNCSVNQPRKPFSEKRPTRRKRCHKSRRERIDSLSEYSSTSNNDTDVTQQDSTQSRASEGQDVGGKQAATKTAVNLRL